MAASRARARRQTIACAYFGTAPSLGSRFFSSFPISVSVLLRYVVTIAFRWLPRVLGGIDILVNNAGIAATNNVEDIAIEEWDRMMAVHLRSVFGSVWGGGGGPRR